jgi:hypothetical protein
MGFICLWPQADFFDLDLGLGSFRLAVFLGPLINELSKIHDTADGRGGIGGDFHKVQLGVARNLQGLPDGNNTDVSTIWADQSDFRDADALINSKF